MKLDPTDNEQICKELLICDKRNDDFTPFDWTNLCYEIILHISQFLSPYDAVMFRRLTRRMLINDMRESRQFIYKSLSPRITEGYKCLHINSLSASYLSDLIAEVRFVSLSSGSNNFTSGTHNLEDLLLQSLYYYRVKDLNVFWKLLEALVKAQIHVNSISSFEYTVVELFDNSCKENLLCLGKYLLKHCPELSIESSIYESCFTCVNNNNFMLFKHLILTRITNHNPIWNNLLNIFNKCVNLKRIDFAKFMLEIFPYDKISDSNSVFKAVYRQDLTMAKLLLKYRKEIDFEETFEVYFYERHASLMDIAGWNDDTELIVLLHSTATAYKINCFESYSPLHMAIYNMSRNSMLEIIKIVTKSGKRTLDQVYDKEYIAKFIVSALCNKDIRTLKLLLSNIGSRDTLQFSESTYKVIETSTILRYCIDTNFKTGFDALICHFGMEVSSVTDRYFNEFRSKRKELN